MRDGKYDYPVAIPFDVLHDTGLSDFEKLLYAEIAALADEDGICCESNNHFSFFYDVTNAHVSTSIKHLAQKGYIEIKILSGFCRQIRVFDLQLVKANKAIQREFYNE